MNDLTLTLLDGMWAKMQKHLLPKHAQFEEAAFVFATVEETPTELNLRAVEWLPVPPEGFEEQLPYFLQLTDEIKANSIKRAHDLQTALIEVHSHPFQEIAEFSPSDLFGFSEFVPHVRWRLKARPYAAIVVAQNTFDSLAWAGKCEQPRRLDMIIADGEKYIPTRATCTGGVQ